MLFIFEGLENTKKLEQIEKLKSSLKFYDSSITDSLFVDYAWQLPYGVTSQDVINTHTKNMVEQFEIVSKNSDKYFFWDSSYMNEYVYGKTVRDTNPETWLFQLETDILQNFQFNTGAGNGLNISDIFLIHLDANSEHMQYVETGFSYAIDDTAKARERFLFIDAVNSSNIPNKFSINVSASKTSYIDSNLIHHSVLSFLRYKTNKIQLS